MVQSTCLRKYQYVTSIPAVLMSEYLYVSGVVKVGPGRAQDLPTVSGAPQLEWKKGVEHRVPTILLYQPDFNC